MIKAENMKLKYLYLVYIILFTRRKINEKKPRSAWLRGFELNTD